MNIPYGPILVVEDNPAFKTLLTNALSDRLEIQSELDDLLKLLSEFK